MLTSPLAGAVSRTSTVAGGVLKVRGIPSSVLVTEGTTVTFTSSLAGSTLSDLFFTGISRENTLSSRRPFRSISTPS
ncbi:hypothetical protein D3C75_1125220 [compost metagenome]